MHESPQVRAAKCNTGWQSGKSSDLISDVIGGLYRAETDDGMSLANTTSTDQNGRCADKPRETERIKDHHEKQ